MATWETVCEILSPLPGTELDPVPDDPAWRVAGKVIARRNPSLRGPGEDALRRARGEPMAIRIDHAGRDILIQHDPETFFTTPHWESNPSVLVWLAAIRADQLRDLLVDAWRSRAPKRLLRGLEAGR